MGRMMKAIGSLLLFSACAGLGFYQSRRYQGRIRELTELLHIMGFLKGEISFAVSTLPEAMERISGKTREPFSGLLMLLSGRMREYSGEKFAGMLAEAIRQTGEKTCLEKEDWETFYQAASQLGYLDKEMQIHILEQYLKEQEQKIGELNRRLPEKMKLFRSLGILAGAFLVIMLL